MTVFLVDSEKYYYEANRLVFLEAGVELDLETYREYFLRNNTGSWHLLSDIGLPEKEIDQLKKKRGKIYSDFLRKENLLIPGAKELVSSLKQDKTLGIVSSSRPEHFDIIHRSTGIPEMVDFILTGDKYHRSKPFPDPYLKALELAECAPDEALVVEDSPRGLQAANAAGLPCIIIQSGLLDNEDFKGAAEIVSNIEELTRNIKRYL